jgi:hypothetical protein
MILNLVRYDLTEKRTIGKLSVNGVFECYTLEDAVRPIKIPKETAIPSGRYQVVITESVRFRMPLPLLLAVPGFSGVRIHTGNVDADTEGCILVGQEKGTDRILKSHAAMNVLFPKIRAALEAGDQVWIEIEKGTIQGDPITVGGKGAAS